MFSIIPIVVVIIIIVIIVVNPIIDLSRHLPAQPNKISTECGTPQNRLTKWTNQRHEVRSKTYREIRVRQSLEPQSRQGHELLRALGRI